MSTEQVMIWDAVTQEAAPETQGAVPEAGAVVASPEIEAPAESPVEAPVAVGTAPDMFDVLTAGSGAAWAVEVGDCREVLQFLPECSIDAVVCDPPYELEFMGREWDARGVAFDIETWKSALRVLKPGGHLVAFGGTRTWHRLAVAIEDAGFEVRDTLGDFSALAWCFGSGFPKSLDVSKAIDKAAGVEREVIGYDASRARPNRLYEGGAIGNVGGTGKVSDRTDNGATRTAPATDAARAWEGWGTALKPAFEPIVLARKPLQGTVAGNVLKYGVGGLNIDGCRIETAESTERRSAGGFGAAFSDDNWQPPTVSINGGQSGRWPANVLLTHSEHCVEVGQARVRGSAPTTGRRIAGRPDSYWADDGGGFTQGRSLVHHVDADGMETVALYACVPGCPVRMLDDQAGYKRGAAHPVKGDEPSAVTDGIYGERDRVPGAFHNDSGGPSRFYYTAKAAKSEREAGLQGVPDGKRGNDHPTVKPVALMRWLVRLVTPPGSVVLDPFTGSGSTGIAAVLEGARFVGIEQYAPYSDIARARIRHWEARRDS